MGSSKALDWVRRGIDDATIFASLTVLAWPVIFGRLSADHQRLLNWLLPVGIVAAAGVVVSHLTDRWPVAKYAPVSVGLLVAALLNASGRGGAGLTWLVIA